MSWPTNLFTRADPEYADTVTELPPIPDGNVDAQPFVASDLGAHLLSKSGWKQGQGLGRNENGITQPIMLSENLNNFGLGYESTAGTIHNSHKGQHKIETRDITIRSIEKNVGFFVCSLMILV